MDDKNGRPIGWAALAVHVDDCPGVGSSDRIIDYIKAGIMVQYECVHGPWKKVLGFKFTCTENTVIMSAEHTIETMYNTYNNFSDPETKYLVYRVWMRHLHYTHNLAGEPPPPVVKPSKKGPTAAKVLTTKEKQNFLLLVGL